MTLPQGCTAAIGHFATSIFMWPHLYLCDILMQLFTHGVSIVVPMLSMYVQNLWSSQQASQADAAGLGSTPLLWTSKWR